jgi:hypothetical protein
MWSLHINILDRTCIDEFYPTEEEALRAKKRLMSLPFVSEIQLIAPPQAFAPIAELRD